jgi:hypothetical protein
MENMKRRFVKLCLLQDITHEGETDEQRAKWVANVTGSVGTEGYAIADDGDDYITAEFSTDEIVFANVEVYCFIGSEHEQERFYTKECVVVQEKATGDYYAYETEDLYEV